MAVTRTTVLFLITSVVLLTASYSLCRDYAIIDVVGDSISEGYNPDYSIATATTGWVHMLYGQADWTNAPGTATITNIWPGITFYNSSQAGSRASDWADDVNGWLSAVVAHDPDLVVLYLGGNDLIQDYGSGGFSAIEQDQYRADLYTIIDALRTNGSQPDIVMPDYYDLLDGQSTTLPPPYDQYADAAAAVAVCNDVIRSVAAEKGCFAVDGVHAAFLYHCYGSDVVPKSKHLSPDYVARPLLTSFDIHPVTEGHGAIYELVYGVLGELKSIPTITSFALTAGQPVFQWTSGYGQNYVIERSEDLTVEDSFVPLATNVSTLPMNTYTGFIESAGSMFYRIRVEE
jgi:lysophospholipase L1-like esterase